jgi:arylsulfatase A-like enzyme
MNAIVIVLRGCPAGWLGAYGNEWVATPHLDRLAAESVVFDRHVWDGRTRSVSDGVLPTPSLTLRVRPQHVVRANHPDTDGPAEFYAAHAEVFDARPQPDDDSPLDHLLRSLPALLDRLPEPWTLWIETDRLLPPWDVPQDVFEAYAEDPEAEPPADGEEPATPWFDPPAGPVDDDQREWLRATFAAVVTKLDAELGALFEVLRNRGLDRTATWVVTADAGQALGEHGYVGTHRPLLHEEVVHLPLIVRRPGGADAGRRVAGFTQPADLPAIVEGKPTPDREVVVSELRTAGGVSRALRTPEWALLVPPDGDPLLFAKPDDRWEVNDLRSRNAELADELTAKLRDLHHDLPEV